MFVSLYLNLHLTTSTSFQMYLKQVEVFIALECKVYIFCGNTLWMIKTSENQEAGIASEHVVVGIKIAFPVLSS